MADRQGDRQGRMDKVIEDVRDALRKQDFTDMTKEEHTDLTSKLYSVVQQETGPELQQNSTRERETSDR